MRSRSVRASGAVRTPPLAAALCLGFAGAPTHAVESATTGVVAEALAEAAAVKAMRTLRINGYRIETRVPHDPLGAASKHFHDELGRLFSSLPPADHTDTTLHIEISEFRVQVDGYRGEEGDVLVPQGFLSGMVRIVNRHGDGVGVMVIPSSRFALPQDAVQHDRNLGIEGASLVFKKILMAN
jgi:hypothetical protein